MASTLSYEPIKGSKSQAVYYNSKLIGRVYQKGKDWYAVAEEGGLSVGPGDTRWGVTSVLTHWSRRGK